MYSQLTMVALGAVSRAVLTLTAERGCHYVVNDLKTTSKTTFYQEKNITTKKKNCTTLKSLIEDAPRPLINSNSLCCV